MNTCTHCKVEFKVGVNRTGKFCTSACMGKWSRQKVVDSWLSGQDPGWSGKTVQIKKAVRAYVLEKANYSCEVCGWNERHPVDGKPLVEVDHVNGDPFNCNIDNLRVLCPNHHAMTPTHRARNMGNGRKARP